MPAMLLLTALLGAAATVSQPCTGDPSHNVGDSWLCDNGCDTCTCEDDGSITAAGCDRGGVDDDAAAEVAFEAFVVKIALAFALVFVCCLVGVCYLMCVKGGSHKASALVREMEDEEREMEEVPSGKKGRPKARR